MMQTCPDEAVQNLTVPFASDAALGNLVHLFDLQFASKMGKGQCLPSLPLGFALRQM